MLFRSKFIAGHVAPGIFKSASWYLLEKMMRLVGAFLVGAWVARHLGPENYGMLAYATALVATLGFLGSLGVESLVIRDMVQRPSHQKEITSTYFFIRLAGSLTVPLFAAGFLILTHPGERNLLLITCLIGVSLIFTSFDVADCWLQSQNQSRPTSLIRLVGFAIGTATRCGLVIADADVTWFAAVAIFESAAIALFYWQVLRQHCLLPAFSRWDGSELRRLLVDGKLMVLSGLTVVVYSKLDLLTIGSMISKEALGPYAIAASMCSAWNMVGMSVAQAWAPHTNLARRSDSSSYIATLRWFLISMAGLSIMGSLVLAALSAWIFDFLLGAAYAPGAAIFSVLIWSSVPIFLGVATSQIIVNDQLYWVSLLRTGIGMLVMLALIVPVARGWSTIGVAGLVVFSSSVATLTILASKSARTTLQNICNLRKAVVA
jgi:PST family polysaccharide transporter